MIAPAISVSTATIFAAPELTRDTSSAKMDVFSEGYGRNDLQAAAVARYPEIGTALAELRKHSRHARMTGSGSAVFASFASDELARSAVDGKSARHARFRRPPALAPSACGLRMIPGSISTCYLSRPRDSGAPVFPAGESPSWLRHRILIPAFEGSNPSSPAINNNVL